MLSHVPKPSLGTAGVHRGAPLLDERVDGVEAPRRPRRSAAATRGSSLSSVPSALATTIEPAAGPQARREGAQHRDVATLLVSATASTSSAGSASGLIRAVALEKTMSTSPQLGGERSDGVGVADVEDAAFDARAGGGRAAAAARTRRGRGR